MPELPEVETVRRGLQPAMEGARIERVQLNRPDLRFPLPKGFAERLGGRRIIGLSRRAKFLLAEIEDAPLLICHLGMSGSFRIEEEGADHLPGTFHHERSKAAAHDHVIFHLAGADGASRRVIYNDPRRFGFMLFAEEGAAAHPMLSGLGVEPTGNALSGDLLRTLFDGRAAPLKAVLLDQRAIAGLGNIYVCEALFRARIDPRKAAGKVSRAALERLVPAIRAVLEQAIGDGGSTLRDYARPDGELGYFATRFAVYGREGQACARDDGGTIKRIAQGGRSTWFCPRCQK